MTTEKQIQRPPWYMGVVESMGVESMGVERGAEIADVRFDPESSVWGGGRGGRRNPRSRGNTDHDANGPPPCCPSCGVKLPPSLLGVHVARTSFTSLISTMFSPGSSMRGGSRGASLLGLAAGGASGRSGHQYEAVGDEGGAAANESNIDERYSVHAASLTGIEDDDLRPRASDSTCFVAQTSARPETGSGAKVASGAAPPPTAAPAEETAPPTEGWLAQFLRKSRGIPGKRRPPRQSVTESLWSFIGALIGITVLAALDQYVAPELDTLLLTASFGATAVLLYAAPTSPLAQPLNLVFGTIISSLTGVLVRMVFQGHMTFLAAGTAVAAAIFVMGLTGTMHPPGGAISLIAVIGGKRVVDMGFWYVLFPGTVGPLVLLPVAVVVNNLNPQRSYPVWWY